MGCGKGNDVTYPNKASFGASSVSKLALFEYITSFPLPHPIKILTMLHQVVTRSFLLWAPACTVDFISLRTLRKRERGPCPMQMYWARATLRFRSVRSEMKSTVRKRERGPCPMPNHGCLRVDKTCQIDQLRQSVAMAIFKMAPCRRMK